MAISDQINGVISKGRDALGAVNAVKSLLPEPLKKALNSFLNGNSTTGQSLRNVESFKSILNRLGGVARTNMFDVQIPVPPMMAGKSTVGTKTQVDVQTRDVGLLCESAVLPGMALSTSDIRRYGYGPVEKKPYSVVFTDQTFSFIGDNTGAIHAFFYKWMTGIVKGDLSPQSSGTTSYNGLNAFEVEYKNDYAVDIVITCYDERDQSIVICTLRRAFPIFLGDIQLSWAENDTFMRIPVTFTYQTWDLEVININSVLTGNNMSGLQKILKVGTAIQTIASIIHKPTGVADILNSVSKAKSVIGGLGGLF